MTEKKKRFLLKLRDGASVRARPGAFRIGGIETELTPLFDVAPPAGRAFTAGERDRWYLAKAKDELDEPDWDILHGSLLQGSFSADELLAIEPDLEQSFLPEAPIPIDNPFAASGPACTFEDQLGDGRPRGQGPHWHLGPRYSDLRAAREAAGHGRDVVIAHLDTGYDPDHGTLPQGLDLARARSFIEGEGENDATDKTPPGLLSSVGHGTGTLSLLAGRLPGGNDYLGGAPQARIIPCRIANSVVHFWTSSVARAIDYAREQQADVISMSMGGVASALWADAVNEAYEAGVTIVCAAGNNFGKFPTRYIVFPARFNRVIAACGVMADLKPYFGFPAWVMQGNHGPRSKMRTAISAFTPNVSWARLGCNALVDMSGQGTSAATPQVAAAAALWLAVHRNKYEPRSWVRVEAVRRALFESALREGNGPSDELGWGRVSARRALEIVPTREMLESSKEREDSASFAFLRGLLGVGFAGDDVRHQMLRLELTQLAQQSAILEQAVDDPEEVTEQERRRFFEAALAERRCSRHLRAYLEQRLTTRPSSLPTLPQAGAPRGAIVRRPVDAVPPFRRLKVYAVDPGLGLSLSTAALNEATLRVAWERNAGTNNALRRGPVGEYLEVVDVDPASSCAYAPVDLNDPLILARDGLDPSEGNPQFHQQMVYAVAMTTIRHFESALGRAALWAPQRITRAGGAISELYVPKLRIYPHGIREANAYYSPDRKALVFGYFPARPHAGGAAGTMIFSCLSHDVIAHETAHALLDGLHRRLQEPTNPDVHAFHEAFADIVAIFQHFTLPELLKFELSRTGGDLSKADRLANLAQQLGEAMGRSKALRSALSSEPHAVLSESIIEPHARGAILVAAVFDAFLAIYRKRAEDVLRLAGNPRPEALSHHAIGALANEAVKTASHVLSVCIRALDYLPPVDVTFGEYLRALITADLDLVPDDPYGYRVAFLEAFRGRGIIPSELRTYSVESVVWKAPDAQPETLSQAIAGMELGWSLDSDRERSFYLSRTNAACLHGWISKNKASVSLATTMNLDETFEVHSVRPARRVAPDGSLLQDLIAVITQRKRVPLDPSAPDSSQFTFRGGCTLIIDTRKGRERIRYAITKNIDSVSRQELQRKHLARQNSSRLAAYFAPDARRETFAMLHL